MAVIKRHTLFLLGLLLIPYSWAQLAHTPSGSRADSAFLPAPKNTKDSKQIDVDFLFNYYEQDGNNSPVTGGLGTESLQDRSGIILIHLPLDSVSEVSIRGGMNLYTSASTDRIDSRVSSASFRDARARMYLSYTRQLPQSRQYWQVQGGGSMESDYLSTSFGLSWGIQAANGNRDLNLGLYTYLDTWMLIFPEELRGTGRDRAPSSRRRSYSLSASLNQVISPRLQLGLSGEFVWQNGMLATPFHRVYFAGDLLPRVENLPLNRFKFPLSLRAHYFAWDWLVMRFFYRFYYDSFDLLAHTFQLETPIKLGPFFSLSPFYRLHHQRAARFFAPFQMHEEGSIYFTSDYDLSSFFSQKIGLGVHFVPLYGIGRFRLGNNRIGIFRELDFRYAYYWRSNGLKAHIFGLQLGFSL